MLRCVVVNLCCTIALTLLVSEADALSLTISEAEVEAYQGVDFQALRKAYSKPRTLWPKAHVDESVDFVELGLLPPIQHPAESPYSDAVYKLGYTLFNDGKLSASGQIACASCHDPDLGWGDGKRVSFGHDRQTGMRNAPTIENVGFLKAFFWDGRAASLEQQALMPIQDPVEMAFNLEDLVERLAGDASYVTLFENAYGENSLSATNIAKALASFQRTIKSRKSDFDYFLMSLSENDTAKQQRYSRKLSDDALWGLDLFRRKARCVNCHHGPRFTDDNFHNLGLTWYKREYEDLGRYNVTGDPKDVGKFKTPSLRGVMNTKPWMHNGLFSSMEGILNIYNNGGVPTQPDEDDPLSPITSSLLQKLDLSDAEINALVAFLEAITAPPARVPKPE